MAGVYMNLTPPIGIPAGLGIGSLFIFIVKLLSAVVGHGGWGVARADTIVGLSEIMVAFYFFKMTKRRLQLFSRGAIAATVGCWSETPFFVLSCWFQADKELSYRAALLAYLIQILTLNMIVAVGEAVATGFAVDYLSRGRPISSRSNCSDVVAIYQDRERISKRRAAF